MATEEDLGYAMAHVREQAARLFTRFEGNDWRRPSLHVRLEFDGDPGIAEKWTAQAIDENTNANVSRSSDSASGALAKLLNRIEELLRER